MILFIKQWRKASAVIEQKRIENTQKCVKLLTVWQSISYILFIIIISLLHGVFAAAFCIGPGHIYTNENDTFTSLAPVNVDSEMISRFFHNSLENVLF